MRVVYINMRNTSNNCPAPLTQYKLYLGDYHAVQLVYVTRAQLQRMSLPCILITFSLLSLAAGNGHEQSPQHNPSEQLSVSVVLRDLLGHLAGMVSVVPLEPPEHLELMEEMVMWALLTVMVFLAGPRGSSGRDGRDGAVGPPGPSAGLDLERIRDIVKLVAQEEFGTCSYLPVTMCPGSSANRPATSCGSILDCNSFCPIWLLLDHQWSTPSVEDTNSLCVLLHGG